MASPLAAMVAEASKQAVRSVEKAAAATQSKGATPEAVVALGRETIGNLPYFEDLGLAGDTAFLFSLGSLAKARHVEAEVAAVLVPHRAAEAETLKAIKHVGVLAEALTEQEALLAAPPPVGEDATRKQAEKRTREEAKAQSKITRARAEAKKDNVRLPAGAELPATAEEARALQLALMDAYMAHSQARKQLERHMQRADEIRDAANKALDDSVSTAYKSQALLVHPDKRRGAVATQEDQLRFQRLKTAYDTLKDAEMRKAYIDTFDHDKFLGQQAAAAAAAASAESRAPGAARVRGDGSAPLRLGGGGPNRCTCPTVAVVSDSAVMLQWSCAGAATSGVYGYEVHGTRVVAGAAARDWLVLAAAHDLPHARLTATGLGPGEWMFRARAVNHAGPGDWSMATEAVLLGDEGAADPEAAARRAAQAREVALRRRAEAQDAARAALHRWAHPQARRSPQVLDELARALGAARRAGLPAAAADARLLQAADDALRELRASAAQRAAIAEWRPKLRELSKASPGDDAAAAEFESLVQQWQPEELDASVRDHCHQLLKKCAALARERCAGDTAALERVLPILHAAAQRDDLWPPGKLAELADAAAGLQRAAEAAQLTAAHARAAEQRRAAKAAAQAAQAARAKAAALAQREAETAAARADAVRAAAAHVTAAQQRNAAAAPASAPVAHRDELDCPICLDTYCCGPGKEPLAFPCGHVVCAACLEQLRTAMARHHCPTCREPFDPAARFGVAEEVRDAATRALRRAADEQQAVLPPPQPMPAPKMQLPPAPPTPAPTRALPQPKTPPSPVASPVKSPAKKDKKNKKAKEPPPPPLPTFLSGFALPPLPQPAPAAACTPLPPLPTDTNIAARFAFLFPT